MLIEKVFADTAGIPLITPFAGGTGSIGDLVGNVINMIAIIVGVIAFFYLIYAGILYITANGNPDQAKKGQQGIINAIIGIVIVILAITIIRVASGLGNTAATGEVTMLTSSFLA